MKNLKNVLFINFGGIGDEILFFPVLQDFKEVYPDASVTLLLEPRSAGCIQLTNLVDHIIKYDVKHTGKVKAFLSLLKILRQGRYEAVISAGSNKFISILLFLSGIKTSVGYDTGRLSRKLLSTAVPLLKSQYAAKMYHDLLKGVEINKEAPLPEIIIDNSAIEKAHEYIGICDKPVIIIHPGVSQLSIQKNIIKSWPEVNWVELIIKLLNSGKYKVVLCGGPDDQSTIDTIRERLAQHHLDNSNFIDIYGKTRNLSELAAVIKLSDILCCVDSAPMHVAVGVRTKIVAIFGPTDEKKLLPEHKDFIALRKDDLSCRPCLWDKQNEVCSTPSCLDIPVSQMITAIDSFGL
jgi:ADP-heptose:LPS heptosyltransferase